MKKKIITSVLVIINLFLSFACWYVLVIYSDINFYDSEIDGLQNIIYKILFPSLIAFKIIFFVFSYIKLNKMYKNKVLRIILILAVTQGIIYGFNFIEITARWRYSKIFKQRGAIYSKKCVPGENVKFPKLEVAEFPEW